MACMDDLAEDTLHYEIMPFLTYGERINFNQCLRPLHRRNEKFTKKQLLEHSFAIISSEYRVKLNLHEYYLGEARKVNPYDYHIQYYDKNSEFRKLKEKSIELLYQIFVFCADEKVAKFMKLFPALHTAVLGRSIVFKDVTYYIGRDCTKEQEENFVKISTKLYDLLSSDMNMKDYYKILKCEVAEPTNVNNIMDSLI
jgi:hypothetical protein